MTPDERQLRLLEFIEGYQQQRGDAPTVREIVRGTGVHTLANVGPDIEDLVRRGLLAYVSEQVTGSEPFTSRQVRFTGPPSGARAGGRSGGAPTGRGPAGPAVASPAPGGGGAPGRGRRVGGQRPMPAGRGGPERQRGGASPDRTRASRPASPRRALPDSPPLRAGLIAAILASILAIAARLRGEPLPAAPALQVGDRSLPWVLPAAILAWALGAAILTRAALRAKPWRWQGLLRAAAIGLVAGLLLAGYEQALAPGLEIIEDSGLPSLVHGTIYLSSLLLPPAFSSWAGAATIGALAAELPKLLVAGESLAFGNLLRLPLIALPVELVVIFGAGLLERRRWMLAGVLGGLAQVLVSAAFLPGALAPDSLPDDLAAALAGGLAAGWLAAWLTDWLPRRWAALRGKGPKQP